MSDYPTPHSDVVINSFAEFASKWPDGRWRELRIYFRCPHGGGAEIWMDPDVRDKDPVLFNEHGFMVKRPLRIVDENDKLLVDLWPRSQRAVPE